MTNFALKMMILHPETKAGDVIMFSGFGSGHGVGQWGSDHERRIVIANFQSRNMNVSRGAESGHHTHRTKL